jgi:hypothetical protein
MGGLFGIGLTIEAQAPHYVKGIGSLEVLFAGPFRKIISYTKHHLLLSANMQLAGYGRPPY